MVYSCTLHQLNLHHGATELSYSRSSPAVAAAACAAAGTAAAAVAAVVAQTGHGISVICGTHKGRVDKCSKFRKGERRAEDDMG